MTHDIPFEMQEEIIKRLPVISLIQFRSVSKAWRSLIDSPPFIVAHTARRVRSHRLLVRYQDMEDDKYKYLSIVDDATFPQQKLALTAPSSLELLVILTVFGSCHGLFCFYAYDEFAEDLDRIIAIIVWNPSIRKSIAISMPDEDGYVFGFGVCPVTNDIKILMVDYHLNPIPDTFKVKVIVLSSGASRISTISVAGDSPDMFGCHLVIDSFIYWLVSSDSYFIDGESQSFKFIRSFDLTNDEFRIVCLPFNLAVTESDLKIFKLKESLAVVKYDFNVNLQGYTVWHMKHDLPNVFMKLFTFDVDVLSPAVKAVLGFRKCGETLLEVKHDEDEEVSALADTSMIYEIVGYESTFCAYSYEETLLLLNQPDSVSLPALDEDD